MSRAVDRSRTMLAAWLVSALIGAPAMAQTPAATPAPAAPPAPATAVPPPLEAEEAFTQKILPPQPSWAFIRGGWGSGGTRIFDGNTGRMVGMVETSKNSDMTIDPAGRFYYVAETIWSKGDRGTRQDMISIYDTTEMKLKAEIAIPGRIIIGGRKQNFILSDDGTMAYVYNYDPASSVNIVDLVRRRKAGTVELPGCASLIPNPGVGFSALCSDGSLATVATGSGRPQITRGAPFFQASADPIFDNFVYDKRRRQTTFLSYTGLIYQAAMAATPTVGQPWSIQQAAGLRAGETKPLDINWFPGGTQMMALHRPTNRLYVLMHKGEYWSHKDAGEEVWVVDLTTRALVKRFRLKEKASNIEITQDAAPLLFVNDDDGTVRVFDTTTFKEKHKIKDAGGGIIATAEAGTPAAPAVPGTAAATATPSGAN